MSASLKPSFDPEIMPFLSSFPTIPDLTVENVQQLNSSLVPMMKPEIAITDPEIAYKELVAPGPAGDIQLLVLRRKTSSQSPRPAIYYMHGGGMVFGNRFLCTHTFDWIKELDAVLISVEYRMGSPTSSGMDPIEDCYAGLKWVAESTEKLRIDPEKIMIAGHSGGGGLAAGTTLLVRDRGGPKLVAQLLIYPMLDDRMETPSSKQYLDEGTWTGRHNIAAWDMVLPGKRGSKGVSIYTAPARATDLSGLPPAFIDVSDAELFRDEDVAYASKLWAAGVHAELHVYPGGWHAFDVFAPGAAITKSCLAARMAWLKRIMNAPSTAPTMVPAML